MVSGFGPSGTFLLGDTSHQLTLNIHRMSLISLEEVYITFADTGAGAASPSLTFLDIHGHPLESIFSSFDRLRVLYSSFSESTVAKSYSGFCAIRGSAPN